MAETDGAARRVAVRRREEVSRHRVDVIVFLNVPVEGRGQCLDV